MKWLCVLISLLIPSITFAAPSVTGVGGSFEHGSNQTISGGSFGTKSPAAPLIWDDGEGATTDSDSAVVGAGSSAERSDAGTGWDEAWPKIINASVTSHRIRYRNYPHEGITTPHSHSNTCLVGGHYQYQNNIPPYMDGAGCEDPPEALYRGVGVTVDNGSTANIWYVSHYYRLNDDWNTVVESFNNHKVGTWQDGATAYGGNHRYVSYSHGSSPAVESGNTCMFEHDDGAGGTNTNNPRLGWIKMEQMMDRVTPAMHVWVDNVRTDIYTPPTYNYRSYAFGGYYTFASDPDNNCTMRGSVYETNKNFRYFDDLYADTTWSRVMLCNTSTYPTTDSYICEPQIPVEWSTSSITVKVNLGALTGTTAYLFVFDSANDANATGYEVTLEEGGTSTTSTMPGVMVKSGPLK